MSKTKATLLLTHGSGSDRSHPTLCAIDEQLHDLVDIHRMDFPYRTAGKSFPDKPEIACKAIEDEASKLIPSKNLRNKRLYLGGRSYGGRMCSILVSKGYPVKGLILLSYPLHPPGKPEKMRTEHFENITVPCLFLSGVKDPFGTPEELQEATQIIPADVTHMWLTGGHEPKNQDTEISTHILEWINTHE